MEKPLLVVEEPALASLCMGTAEASARWHSPTEVWLDHTTLTTDDRRWLSGVEWLTLWSVKLPQGFLASLPALRYLDVRGGTAPSVAAAEGCTALRYLGVNQVRGLSDLSAVLGLQELLMLSLYGLPKVQAVPSLASPSSRWYGTARTTILAT